MHVLCAVPSRRVQCLSGSRVPRKRFCLLMRLATDIFDHYLQENLNMVSYGVCEIF